MSAVAAMFLAIAILLGVVAYSIFMFTGAHP